jgi:outer membrane biosynthesis protein TonB
MLIFAKFTMRDSGLPIHINTPHVTQVRLTLDGEPAIYLVGKETPIVVEGTLEAALKKLEAAGAGFRLAEPEPPAPVPVPAPAPAPVTVLSVAPPPSPPPLPPAPVALAKPAPKPKPKPQATAAKVKPAPKTPAPKPEVVAVLQRVPPAEVRKPAKATPPPAEQTSGGLSWFKGLR